jgi:hypothetical protein
LESRFSDLLFLFFEFEAQKIIFCFEYVDKSFILKEEPLVALVALVALVGQLSVALF